MDGRKKTLSPDHIFHNKRPEYDRTNSEEESGGLTGQTVFLGSLFWLRHAVSFTPVLHSLFYFPACIDPYLILS